MDENAHLDLKVYLERITINDNILLFQYLRPVDMPHNGTLTY